MTNYVTESFKKLKVIGPYKPKVISLFSGCGGLDLTFHKAGYEMVWANDFNEYAVATFAANISKNIYYESIEDVDIKALPKADIILGGFPCQDFSQIWKKPGLNGTRGNLYSYFCEVVNRVKPKLFIGENVKGLLSANNGLAIKTIIDDFKNIKPGYVIIPKLVNFADYGVPQLRERVLLIGVRKDTNFNLVIPGPTHGLNDKKHVSAGRALSNIPRRAKNQEHMNIQPRTAQLLSKIPAGGNFTDIDENDPLYVKGMISHVYRRIHPDEPSKTIIAGGGGGTWGYHFPEPRSLTNRERARIQGFTDDFVFKGSFGEIRRQIGNAVPPVGMIPFVNQISKLFRGQYAETDLDALSKSILNISVKDLLNLVRVKEDLKLSNFIRQKTLI